MTITLTKPIRVGGVELAAATTQSLSSDVEADLVARGCATYTTNPMLGGNVQVMAEVNDFAASMKLSAGDRVFCLPAQKNTLRIATFGDSLANTGSTNTDTSVWNVPFPASSSTVVAVEPHVYQTSTKYPKAWLVANGGISGQNTTQMLARDSAGASASRKAVQDVVDLYPDAVLLRAGSINDLVTVTAGTLSATVAATYANHVALINRFTTNGVYVIDEGLFGYSAAGATDPATTRIAIGLLNQMFADYAKTVSGVSYISVVGRISNPNGSYMSGMSTDGIHLSARGQQELARLESAALSSVFGPSLGARYNGVNLSTNPQFAASSIVGYGTVATGITIQVTSVTRQNAKIEVIDGKIMQTCEFVPTAASANAILKYTFDPTLLSIVANEKLGIEFDFMIDPLGLGMPTPTATQARLTIAKAANGNIVADQVSVFSGFTLPESRWLGHCAFQPFQCQEASAALTSAAFIVLALYSDDMVPYRLGMSPPRIVKI